MSKKDNRIILDISKVSWGRFYYQNQWGHTSNFKVNYDPEGYYHGIYVDANEPAVFHPDFPGETLRERYIRRGVEHDKWEPQMAFRLHAGEILIYTGDKALSMRDAWNARVFKKTKKGK
jgi:hypothetical protein